MICNICSSKKITSTVSVFYLDRKIGDFDSVFGRKGAIAFCEGNTDSRFSNNSQQRLPASIRTSYRCSDCSNDRIVASIHYDGTNLVRQ